MNSRHGRRSPDAAACHVIHTSYTHIHCHIYKHSTVWVKKIPPEDLWQFFQNGWEFFNQILHAYYALISTLDYKLLFNYLCTTLTKLGNIKRHHPVHIMCARYPPSAETHAGIFWHFPKQLGIFNPNFTHVLNIHMHARMQIFNHLQLWWSYAILSATTQRAFRSIVDILSTLWWSRLIWHNFVKVADNWIKICNPA